MRYGFPSIMLEFVPQKASPPIILEIKKDHEVFKLLRINYV